MLPLPFFDINQRNWSEEIIKELDLKSSLFPPIYESAQIIGQVSPSVQKNWESREMLS